jgi:C4-type Zn-finger protein
LVESSEDVPMCPLCGGQLRYRDSRPRIIRREGGIKDQLLIRRFRCEDCHHYHSELPDCVVPYKHYETETISGVLEEIVTPADADSENYPSETTMERWKEWYRQNKANMEGHLQRISYRLGLDTGGSAIRLLEYLQSTREKWLEAILRVIYNSGGYLAPIRA